MKVAQSNEPALISNAGGRVIDIQFGTSREAQRMMLDAVTNSLYTNKPMAVWREYGCNAADANIDAGRPDSPIEITLPTRMLAEAVIRDFGKGMSEEIVVGVYSKLGESEKRNTNKQTGTFGIGAKCGFAYGDMFTVITFTGGMKTTYQFFKEDGMPRMQFYGSEPTDAPDGTEVRVPVRAVDIELFAVAAERTFRYFTVPPIVHGGQLEYERGHQVFKGEDWTMTGDQKPVAIMGNVGYEIKPDSLDLDYSDTLRDLLEIGIEIHFEIGDLEITPSRESLQYTDAVKKAVITKVKRIITELASIFKQQIATAPNLWEAKKAYAEAFERLGSGEKQTLRELIDGKVEWQGTPIKDGRFDLEIGEKDKDAVSVTSFDKGRRGNVRRSKFNAESVTPGANVTLAINDLPHLNIPHSRARGFFHANPSAYEFVVLTFRRQSAKDNFWKQNQMDGVPLIPLSTVPRLLTANGGSGAPSAHRSKHSARAFVLDEQTTASRYNNKVRSAWWKVDQIDKVKGKGTYVAIRGFKVETPNHNGDPTEPHDFLHTVKVMRNRGVISGPIYAFKRDKDGKLPKLGKGWKMLDEAIEDHVASWAQKYAQEIADYKETQRVSPLLPGLLAPMLPDCIAKQLIETRARMDSRAGITLWDAIRGHEFGAWCSQDIKLPEPTENLSKLQDQVRERYPMVALNSCFGADKKTLTALSEYIKLVETNR
jgi:hypothetical protein